MSRLIDNQTWDYSDYLAVVRELNEVEMDSVSQKLVASVHLFTTMPVRPLLSKEVRKRLSANTTDY